MDKYYKRLVELVIKMHLEQATEDGTYNPQGSELEAILLAHQIDEIGRNALPLKDRGIESDESLASEAYALAVLTSIDLIRLNMKMEREGVEGKSSVETARQITHLIQKAILSFHKNNTHA
jgi:hypothetical protein